MSTVSERTVRQIKVNAKKDRTFPVSEIFGPTIQGEGVDTGVLCSFVRFALCEYSCSWCDSRYTWDNPAYLDMSAEHIWEHLCDQYGRGFKPPYVVLTGGNPALQKNMLDLMRLSGHGKTKWAVETQGSVYQKWISDCDSIVLSPKLESAKQVQTPETLATFLSNMDRDVRRDKVSIKCVAFSSADLDEILKGYFLVGLDFDVQNFVIGVGTLASDMTEHIMSRYLMLTAAMFERKNQFASFPMVRITPQNHVLLWGHARGV